MTEPVTEATATLIARCAALSDETSKALDALYPLAREAAKRFVEEREEILRDARFEGVPATAARHMLTVAACANLDPDAHTSALAIESMAQMRGRPNRYGEVSGIDLEQGHITLRWTAGGEDAYMTVPRPLILDPDAWIERMRAYADEKLLAEWGSRVEYVRTAERAQHLRRLRQEAAVYGFTVTDPTEKEG